MLKVALEAGLKGRACARTKGATVFPRGWLPPFEVLRSVSACLETQDDNRSAIDAPFFQQVRWRRKDGNRFSVETRPPTKKQRKDYRRKVAKLQAEKNKHGVPGSKAGRRRQFQETLRQDLLNPLPPLEKLEYDMSDAILDDVVGNTKYLSAQPTPEPAYLGHRHKYFFNRVADMMDVLLGDIESSSSSTEVSTASVPTDDDISLALRAYRDRYGTRRKPVGVADALKHLLQDMKVPLSFLGAKTYSTLMTCSQTPTEARRVVQLMKDQGHPMNDYTWSILVDVYGKVGDVEGCVRVHNEMIQLGIQPTLSSYTSLIASCGKLCSDGRQPHKVRAEAAKIAWQQWQEMQIAGIEADALAYGAMLGVHAAKGQPERAISLLEQMQQFEVNPTTLCFSHALRAVARSQSVAVRFENGSSKKNKRREFITKHHGIMARKIVIMAENAEVDQDQGFVAALIQCAASAGDTATAKAVYIAHSIRSLDDLRTIGDDRHLAALRGPEDEALAITGSEGQVVEHVARTRGAVVPHGEREYGQDTRALSAILHACSVATSSNGIGTMWQGRENRGLLCENSLRLMLARRVPRYLDNSIPGATLADTAPGQGEERDYDYRGGKRRPRKYRIGEEDRDAGHNLDEIPEEMANIFLDEDGRLKEEFRKPTFDDIWKLKYGDADLETTGELLEAGVTVADRKYTPQIAMLPEVSSPPEPLYFDANERRWKPRVLGNPDSANDDQSHVQELHDDSSSDSSSDSESTDDEESADHELVFDPELRRWTTKPLSTVAHEARTEFETRALEAKAQTSSSDTEFQLFYNELRRELVDSGDEESLSIDEARELFESLRDEFADDLSETEESEPTLEELQKQLQAHVSATDDSAFAGRPMESFDDVVSSIRHDWRDQGYDVDDASASTISTGSLASPPSIEPASAHYEERKSIPSVAVAEPSFFSSNDVEVTDVSDQHVALEDLPGGDVTDREIEVLRNALPGLPESRLRRIVKVFHNSLSDPSLLELSLVVRERMPDYLTNTWLKQMSSLTARYVVNKAYQDGALDMHILNGYLEVETTSGSIDRALDFHRNGFAQYGFEPTAYTDRMVLQMLVRNRRFQRALKFKQEVESAGRPLDLASYGSLADFCGRHHQLGSALLLVEECIRHHHAPPGEGDLKQVRALCRRHKVDRDSKVLEILGEDPTEWVRYSEANLKREMSKRGRRDTQLPGNIQLRI